MEQSSVLIGFAQLCLVLTGFVAVFVTFFSVEKTKSKPDQHHALAMLIASVVSLIIALVPILFDSYGFVGQDLWFWSSAIGFAISLTFGGVMLSVSLRLSKAEFMEAGLVHMISAYSLGTTGSGFMLWNLISVSGPGPYLLAMVLTFLVGLTGFVSFALQNFLKL